MTKPMLFDPTTHTIGLDRSLTARRIPERPDPPVPVDGVTVGVATMSTNSPHGGEMHPDGDEVLYLISGRARVVFIDSPDDDIEMTGGDGLVIPRGLWHRVDIIEPCQIVYVTPGPNNDFVPLDDDT
jgi:mannose-6-phosphate isomerase-like protein (cupin superfamily)